MVTRKIANGFIEPVTEVTEVTQVAQVAVESTLFQKEPPKKVGPVLVPPATNVVVEEEPLIIKKVEPVAPKPEPKVEVVKKELIKPRHPRNVPRFTEVVQ